MMIGRDGIFAGGDMTTNERSVSVAIGHGKKAARYINAYLNGTKYEPAPKHQVVGYERLHRWYATQAPRVEQTELPAEKRIESFEEVRIGLTREEALFEAQRCLSCGNCFECDGCFGACPQTAIVKLGAGKRYQFNYDLCTGCAVCYEQCPCHAIEMVPEY
jgi:formate dehydrogenase (NADP+) beta subunit